MLDNVLVQKSIVHLVTKLNLLLDSVTLKASCKIVADYILIYSLFAFRENKAWHFFALKDKKKKKDESECLDILYKASA